MHIYCDGTKLTYFAGRLWTPAEIELVGGAAFGLLAAGLTWLVCAL